jgi:hypothetical protein
MVAIKTFLSFKLATEKKSRSSSDGECFMEFAMKLECQAQKFTYGNLEDTLIAERIVVGIYNEAVRKKILQETMLTLEGSKKICSVAESTSKQLKLRCLAYRVNCTAIIKKDQNPGGRMG